MKPFTCTNSFNLTAILWSKGYHYVCFILKEVKPRSHPQHVMKSKWRLQHFGFRLCILNFAGVLEQDWYSSKVNLALLDLALQAFLYQSCHWSALVSIPKLFPTSGPLYMLFHPLCKFYRSSQLSKMSFPLKAFCGHSIQSNRVLSHGPLLCFHGLLYPGYLLQ